MSLQVDAPRRLRALLRSGLVVRLDGFAGATRVSVRLGRQVLASRRVQVGQRTRIRFSRQARRRLARRRSVTLVVTAGPLKKTIRVKR
jgi:hypothetical protein